MTLRIGLEILYWIWCGTVEPALILTTVGRITENR
jgi:hypothetical protein